MRVLTVHNSYREPGGEDLSARMEAALLRSKGHEVLEYWRSNREVAAGFGHVGAALQAVWSTDTARQIDRLLRDFKPDIVHVNNFWFRISPAIYWVAKRHGRAVVQSLRNYRILCPDATFFRRGKPCELCKAKWFAYPGIFYGCYRASRLQTLHISGAMALHRLIHTWQDKVDLYVTPTEFAKGKFIEAGFPAAKIMVKPNFVAPDPHQREERGCYALFVGRLAPEKGLLTLLRAWQSIPHIPLQIVGSGPLWPEVQSFRCAQPSADIQILGQCDPQEVFARMKKACFVILPSEWYETFGRVAIEAFACGVPVLASRLGAMAELIDDGHTGLLFRPGDAADLAATARWAMEHPAAMARMGARARQVYEALYTDEQNYRRLMEIYARALSTAQCGAC
jgi:glycosyltransferase involved in cell wall biosynthesis